MRFKNIIRLFEDGSVCVFGQRGRGKDLLMSNVCVRRNLPYISNIDYGGDFTEFNLSLIDCGNNNYKSFLSGHLNKFEFNFADGTDIYLTDCGVYFPAQYCNELNRDYKNVPVFAALSRQIGECNLHFNSQNLARVWDKLREQSDTYILCRRCIYFKGFVFQFITIYDQYDTAVMKQRPLRLRLPLFANREMRYRRQVEQDRYLAQYGLIRNGILFYKNKSSYNTRRFRDMLRDGDFDAS